VRMRAFWIVLVVWAGAASCSAHVDTSSSVSLLQNDLGSEAPPRHALEPSYTFKADDLPHSLEEAGIEASKAESSVETPLWGKEATIRRRRRRRRTDKELGDLLDRVDRVKKAKRKEIDSKIGQCHTSVWGDWAPCQKDGTRSRNRIVEIQPQHGLRCPTLLQTIFCPLDCTVGPFNATEGCDKGCGGGTQTVKREMLTPSLNGGSVCPALTGKASCNNQPCPVHCQVSSWAKDGVCKTPGNECVMGIQGLKRSIVVPNVFGGKECPPLTKTTPCVLEECLSMFRKQAAMLEPNATNATTGDAKTLEFAYKATKQLLAIATKTAATGDFKWTAGVYKEFQALDTESVDVIKRVAGGLDISLFATDTDACLAEAKTYKDCSTALAAELRNTTCGSAFDAWSVCVKKCQQFNCAYLRPYTSAYKASFYKPTSLAVVDTFAFVASSPRYVPELHDIHLENRPHENRDLPPEEFRESLMGHPELATLDLIDMDGQDGVVSRVADLPKIHAVAAIKLPNEAGVFVLHPVKYSKRMCEQVKLFSSNKKTIVCQQKEQSSEYSLTYISNIRNYTEMLGIEAKCKQYSDQWTSGLCHRKLIHKTNNMVPCGDKTGYCYAHNYFQGCVHAQQPDLCKCVQTLIHKNKYCNLAKRARRQSLIHSAAALKGLPIVAASKALAAGIFDGKRYAFITRESDMEIHRVDLDGPCGDVRRTCNAMSMTADAAPPMQCYDMKKPGWSTVVTSRRKYPISCSAAKTDEERCSFCYEEEQIQPTVTYDFQCFPRDRLCGCEPTYATSAAVWRGHDRVTAIAVQNVGSAALFVATNGPIGSTLWRVTGVFRPSALQCLNKHSCSSATATALIPSAALLYVSHIHVSSPDGKVVVVSFYDEGRGKIYDVSDVYYEKTVLWNATIFKPDKAPAREKSCIDVSPHCHAKVWQQVTFWDREQNKCFTEQKAMDDECCATCSKMKQWHENQWQDEHCTVSAWSKYSVCKKSVQERHRLVRTDLNQTTGHKCPLKHESRKCMPLTFKLEVTNTVGGTGIYRANDMSGESGQGKLYVLSQAKHELQSMASKTSVVCPKVMAGKHVNHTFHMWKTPTDEPIVGEESQVLLGDESAKWRVRPYKKTINLGSLGKISKDVLCFQEVRFDAIRNFTRLGEEQCCIRKRSQHAPQVSMAGSTISSSIATSSANMSDIDSIQTALKTL